MDPRVLMVADLLSQNPRMPLRELAAATNLSPSRLQHLFVSHQQVSIRSYSQQRIFSRAARLLVETQLSVKEIQALVGFATASAFCRGFKKKYSASPQAFRRAHDCATPPSRPTHDSSPMLNGR